jgi:hypothetical protein
MNYELCKQLKEVGFPQNWKNDFYTSEGLIFRHPTNRHMIGDEIYIPTLSELIEACGEDFELLRMVYKENEKYWIVQRHSTGEFFYGSTPEEAVAKLYISLHTDNMSDQEAINLDRDMWGGRGKG